MDQADKQSRLAPATEAMWPWIAVALGAHIGWGAYPVFLRYLQTVSGLPSFSLLAMGNLTAIVLGGIFLIPRLDKRFFRQRIIWIFAFFVVLRGVTNLLATRYTLAIYVQLIYLMTPFTVAFLSRLLLKERLPSHTVKAVTLASVGALLIMSGDIGGALDSSFMAEESRNDLLGIGLALASSLFLAGYMIVTRRSASRNTPGAALWLTHLVTLSIFSLILSNATGENWGAWQTLNLSDWVVFAALSLGVLVGANLGQVRSIQVIGASFVSSLMPVRLLSALLLAWLLLGERLTSVWQLVGTAVVIVTITWYIRQQ